MSDLTTEEKRAALTEAGKKIRTNASEEDIAMAYLELEVEREMESETGPPSGDEALTNAEPEPEPEPETSETSSANAVGESIHDVIKRVGDIHLGDRNPDVIAWARENLSREEFAARYAGRI